MQLQLPFLAPSGDPPPSQPPQTPPRRSDPDAGIVFVRVPRARRYILRIKADGTLRVTVPRWGSRREAREFVTRQRRWIERERERVRAEHAPTEWAHGSRIFLRGDSVALRVDGTSALAVSYGERSVALREGETIRQAVERDLRLLARAELEPRLRELAAQHGLECGRISIRNQRSRWGSCARNGNIALNFRLVQMPVGIRDYVLVHELMHMRQQNHSRRFWRLVEQACPAFRDAERWLRQEGKALF